MPDNFCPSCGAPARPGARFCPSCGQAADSGARTMPAPMQTPAPAPPGGGAMPFQATRPAPPRSKPRPAAMIVLQGAILTLLIFAVGAVGLYSITRMAGADKTLYTEGVEILGRVGTMGEAAASMRSTMRDLLLATDQAVNQRFKKNYDGDKDRLHLTIRELADLSKGDPDVKAVVDEVSSTMDKYFVFADDVARLAMENKNTESYTYMKTTALPANNAFREALAKMRAVVHDTAEGRMRQNEKTAKTSAITLALCLAAAAALAAAATATAALAAARR